MQYYKRILKQHDAWAKYGSGQIILEELQFKSRFVFFNFSESTIFSDDSFHDFQIKCYLYSIPNYCQTVHAKSSPWMSRVSLFKSTLICWISSSSGVGSVLSSNVAVAKLQENERKTLVEHDIALNEMTETWVSQLFLILLDLSFDFY